MDNNSPFLDWLSEIVPFLPPKMTTREARLLFERKVQEEKEIEDKKSSPT